MLANDIALSCAHLSTELDTSQSSILSQGTQEADREGNSAPVCLLFNREFCDLPKVGKLVVSVRASSGTTLISLNMPFSFVSG